MSFETVTIGPCTLIRGDCLEVLPTLRGVDAVIADPPYGARKAEWDSEFPVDWFAAAKAIAPMVCVITGSAGVKDAVQLVGESFIDVIAARNLNGMTRGPIGYGNWLSCVVSCGKPSQGPNCFDFVVEGEMPNHPSPKPLAYMLKLVERLTDSWETVCDPFMGSGTTGVACVSTGRSFIGIERDAGYFKDACERIRKAWKLERSKLRFEPQPVMKQRELLESAT